MARCVSLVLLLILAVASISVNSSTQFHRYSPNDVEVLSDEAGDSRITWSSNDDPEPHQLDDNAIIEGDLIRIDARFSDANEDPENLVQNISWIASRGFIMNRTGSLVIPDEEYDPFVLAMDLDQFKWEYIPDILNGDNVQLTLFHSNSDTDVLAFWNDTNPVGWSVSTNILGFGMATASVQGESSSFIAERSGVLAVGIYCYDKQPGDYQLVVDTRETESGEEEGNRLSYDTWRWGRNITIDFEFVGTTESGAIRKISLTNVTFRNFFKPLVTNVNVLSQGDIRQITWDVLDRNTFESHTYEVLVSLDGGFSFQLIAAGLQSPIYSWNIAGYGQFDRCQIQVRAYDDVGLQGVGYSPLFVVSSTDEATNERWFTTASTGNMTYTWGSIENEVSWNLWIIDSFPMPYEVTIDESVVMTGWTSGGQISVNVDGLDIGTHEVMLIIEIGSTRYNDTILVEVLPDTYQYVQQVLISFTAVMILLIAIMILELNRRL